MSDRINSNAGMMAQAFQSRGYETDVVGDDVMVYNESGDYMVKVTLKDGAAPTFTMKTSSIADREAVEALLSTRWWQKA